MNFPTYVKMVEVGARDGLQNEASIIPTEIKIKFIDMLSQSGLSCIEATSFVSAKKIPQLADNSIVLQNIKKNSRVQYPVLVPNKQGLLTAIAAGAKEIAIFGSVSETFSQKNINCSVEESFTRFAEVIALAKENKIWIRGYLSCVLGCPYEGEISPEKVTYIANKLYHLGCDEISLGDTIGIGTPGKTILLLEEVLRQIPAKNLAVHFHDTYGQALTNIYVALEKGIHIIDSSVGGLGGCPYAQGATGNVASEDVLYMLNGLGIKTGVNLEKLITSGASLLSYLNRPSRSKVATAYDARKKGSS